MSSGTDPRKARRSLLFLLMIVVLGNLVVSRVMESRFGRFRDPEYGRKALRLSERMREYPDKPMVVVLGSSRVDMGLKPAVLDMSRQTKVVFNASLIGAGPLMQLMCLKRLLHDGLVPHAVLVEVWAPFLYQDGIQLEELRIDPNRLREDDLALMREYYRDPDQLTTTVREARWVPIFAHRSYFMSELAPNWIPWTARRDNSWYRMDDWGWLPGLADDPDPVKRSLRHANSRTYYDAILKNWRPHPLGDKALRELLTLCRDRSIPVSLVHFPESSEFRSWYSPTSRKRADDYLAGLCREFGIRLYDMRTSMPDHTLLDGFHLTIGGAEEFTRKFAEQVLPSVSVRTKGNLARVDHVP